MQKFLNDYKEITNLFQNDKKIMLVCDEFIKNLSQYSQIIRIANENNIDIVEFSDFEPNPKYESVLKGIDLYKKTNCGNIIVIGGGSAIDVAKCIKVFNTLSNDNIYLSQKIEENNTKLLAIPSTSGTGSESTHFAVIYYQNEKKSIDDKSVLPEYVLLDEKLIFSVPSYMKKCTILDALCHGIESMWSINSTDKSKEKAMQAITSIVKHKNGYLENIPDDVRAVLAASNNAGQAINISKTTACHAMSYKITSLFKIPHGHAVAICLPKVWRYMLQNIDNCCDKRGKDYVLEIFNGIAACFGRKKPEEAIEDFENILYEFNIEIPKSVTEQNILTLVDSVNTERLGNHPVAFSKEDLKNIYLEIFRV